MARVIGTVTEERRYEIRHEGSDQWIEVRVGEPGYSVEILVHRGEDDDEKTKGHGILIGPELAEGFLTAMRRARASSYD